jgi:DNA-binding response OmpR family regulator
LDNQLLGLEISKDISEWIRKTKQTSISLIGCKSYFIDEETKMLGIGAGICDFIIKPVKTSELMKLFSRLNFYF